MSEMVSAPTPSGLLLKLRADSEGRLSLDGRGLAQGGESLMEVDERGAGLALAGGGRAQWVRIAAADNPWDQAHALVRMGFAAAGGEVLAAEPEFEQQWMSASREAQCVAEPQSRGGGRAVGAHDGWHLDKAFSGLGPARAAVSASDQARVLIAHVDTGYDPRHQEKPRHLQPGERNFVKNEGLPTSAEDVSQPGGFLRNHGHGTGTISLLAGPTWGGAPQARVLPIRIADGVVRFSTGTMAQGFSYAVDAGAHVLSMSMGGLASEILADAVNKAYAAGVVMVTAAGNNVGGLPVRSVVYPARMRRVIAACGVMANLKPYADLTDGVLEGCFGPGSKMATALSGFTPNIPWAEIGCPSTVDQDGQGTSCATPQIAAAAALWLARHWTTVMAYPQPWMRGEAVRQALFLSAANGKTKPNPKLGWGPVRAEALLAHAPALAAALTPAPRASAAWAWLKLLTGTGVGFAEAGMVTAEKMLGVEFTQLVQRDPEVAAALIDPDADTVSPVERRRVLEAAEASPLASKTLKATIATRLARKVSQVQPPPSLDQGDQVLAARDAEAPTPAPERRRLRIFALDPSLGGSLNSYEDQIATVDIRNEAELSPGPIGEYVEVVDVDPASNRFYPPVDLNHRNVLLQEGVPPSEGNPAFHQQMTYAVAMRTIEHFEAALGRKALWASHWSGKINQPDRFVRRLRIYPHALRQQNAFYSPVRKALLFGYFPAHSQVSDLTPPGTMVFSCLSADIIAHETTHALLDGQARTLREPSNPDVRAFHEGFADIVALFQQFTYRDLVRREIARARGDLSSAALLGGLARQFGEGAGLAGPLRSYPSIDAKQSYETSHGAHGRGAVLVAAIYRAFLAIVERRTADLVRLATGGSGVLPEGALHPDLVDRLTDETTTAARHVLRICIRALDYCPPIDLTFGEYLRALITADLEEVATDRYGYRIAFLEAFRRAQLLPRNLRTVSLETLRWRHWDGPSPAWLDDAVAALKIDLGANLAREQIFAVSEQRKEILHAVIEKGLTSQADCDALGLEFGLPRFETFTERVKSAAATTLKVDTVRVARRVRPDGAMGAQLVVVIRQRRPEILAQGDPGLSPEHFWFRGGATLIIDLLGSAGPKIRYAIVKPILSQRRAVRERAFRLGEDEEGLRAMYLSGDEYGAREPFALLHAERGEL